MAQTKMGVGSIVGVGIIAVVLASMLAKTGSHRAPDTKTKETDEVSVTLEVLFQPTPRNGDRSVKAIAYVDETVKFDEFPDESGTQWTLLVRKGATVRFSVWSTRGIYLKCYVYVRNKKAHDDGGDDRVGSSSAHCVHKVV